MNKESLPKQRVLLVLEHLEPGQHIKGQYLMLRAGIEEKRTLYRAIRALRAEGNLIGSCKEGPGGYFLIRNDEELERAIRTLKAGADDLLKTAATLRNVYKEKRKETSSGKKDIS